MLKDHRIKVSEIAWLFGLQKVCVYNILHEHLQMRKLSARWVAMFSHTGSNVHPYWIACRMNSIIKTDQSWPKWKLSFTRIMHLYTLVWLLQPIYSNCTIKSWHTSLVPSGYLFKLKKMACYMEIFCMQSACRNNIFWSPLKIQLFGRNNNV